jgi:RNA polymerase sigma-70 factor, ECF subfamily
MRTPPRRAATSEGAGQPAPTRSVPAHGGTLSRDSEIAGAIKALVVAGDREAARERFADLVARQQRRAVRIAYHYLRDAHDADEAVQDAFVKVFTHITSYREELPFEVWFTRILVNGCLDLRKARARRLRWVLPMASGPDMAPPPDPVSPQRSVEEGLLSSERTREITAAVDQLPDRQRTVFTLCHMAEQSTSEVSRALGLSEATVRVHLFRAIRKLRKLLAAPVPAETSSVESSDRVAVGGNEHAGEQGH